jgi:hypothetical protein
MYPTACLGEAHVRFIQIWILNFKIQYILYTMSVFISAFIVVFYAIR